MSDSVTTPTEPRTEAAALPLSEWGHCQSDCCDAYPRLHVHGDKDEYDRWLASQPSPAVTEALRHHEPEPSFFNDRWDCSCGWHQPGNAQDWWTHVLAAVPAPSPAPAAEPKYDRSGLFDPNGRPAMNYYAHGQPLHMACDESCIEAEARAASPSPAVAPLDATAVERVAAVEHEQWEQWSRTIVEQGLTPERIERWQRFWVPYEQLDEATKEHDRVWARKALAAYAEASEQAASPGEGEPA